MLTPWQHWRHSWQKEYVCCRIEGSRALHHMHGAKSLLCSRPTQSTVLFGFNKIFHSIQPSTASKAWPRLQKHHNLHAWTCGALSKRNDAQCLVTHWIVGAGWAAATLISRRMTCHRMRSETCEQQMADLPADYMESIGQFLHCGVDYFGPFSIKEGCKELKRWGIVFTCLARRAVPLDSASSLMTYRYINAFRRFTSLQGPVRIQTKEQTSLELPMNFQRRSAK